VIPNLAVIEELKKHGNVDLLYIGSRDGIEKKIIEKIGVEYHGIFCGKLRRYASFDNFLDIFKLAIGVMQAIKILKKWKPDRVFSKGGYVSLPVVASAKFLNIPVIVHESDLVPGLANKMSFRVAKTICLSFEESMEKLAENFRKKAVVTGTPIRSWIADGDADKGRRFTGLDGHRPVILVTGGSQGAEQINELVRESLDELLRRYQIVHLVGRGNLDISIHKKGYVQYEYLDEQMADVYAVCEMVISRGGANSLAEIAFLKKKALIIPLGTAASRGDQIDNAKIFVKKFGWSMLMDEISREDFIKSIEMTYNNRVDFGEEMKNGSDEIADIILSR